MFKFLIIAFLIIALVPPVRRFVFWLLVGRQLVKQQRDANQPFRSRREGETRVDSTPNGTTESKLKGGEYVDYEEVK